MCHAVPKWCPRMEHTHRGSGIFCVGLSLSPAVGEAWGADGSAVWQKRYYDFNVFSDHKRIEKLRYMHRNPVKRGLVEKPEHWKWSSYCHYLTGMEGMVEIESEWTARKREKMGILPKLKHRNPG
jgi:hypothetical protein